MRISSPPPGGVSHAAWSKVDLAGNVAVRLRGPDPACPYSVPMPSSTGSGSLGHSSAVGRTSSARLALGLATALFLVLAVAGCGGRAGNSRAQVITCLKREGLLTKPPLSALVNPTGLRYELEVSLMPGLPPSPDVPEATIDMFSTSDQAAQYATGGEDRQGPAVITTTADATSAQVKKVEACAF